MRCTHASYTTARIYPCVTYIRLDYTCCPTTRPLIHQHETELLLVLLQNVYVPYTPSTGSLNATKTVQ